jgi:hypothetical protein
MALWTDIIDPATLTGYARASLADYEASRGTLAHYLPNREIPDIVARFVKGSTGLIDVAAFRAYDAEPEIGKAPSGKRVSIELPRAGAEHPRVGVQPAPGPERQPRRRVDPGGHPADHEHRGPCSVRRDRASPRHRAADRHRHRHGFMADDFGRSGSHAVTAGTLWSTVTADALGDLQTWTDTYRTDNGVAPGSILMSTRVLRSLAKLNQFATQLSNGQSRPATQANVLDTIEAAGLPPIVLYDRNVSVAGSTTKVITDNR